MERLENVLTECLNKELVQIIISNNKAGSDVTKIRIRPVVMKQHVVFQITQYIGKQVFHKNEAKEETISYIINNMTNTFKQAQIQTVDKDYTVLVSKKGKVTITGKKSKEVRKQVDLTHNRKKKYIIDEGSKVDFLVDLGVMTKEGKIVNSRYDKFRQINRFLEFIEDIADKLPKERRIKIVDFGCGKSYLTFAIYHFLKNIKGYDVDITGLDLKEEVIENCNKLSKKYGYDDLKFIKGDIADYSGDEQIDMVVTLHACDTATDYALAKAVKWNAKVILSVPCCQHELNNQIKNEMFSPVLNYGILKERMSALITDGLRASMLEEQGYDTQILEFIDMEHTPKNLLIRAVKTNRPLTHNDKVDNLMDYIQVNPTLKELLR